MMAMGSDREGEEGSEKNSEVEQNLHTNLLTLPAARRRVDFEKSLKWTADRPSWLCLRRLKVAPEDWRG